MTFHVTPEDEVRIAEWEKTHNCKYRTDEHGVDGEIYVGAIGGATTYMFTPNSVGAVFKVRCACGAELDLTNYEEW